MIIAIFLAMLIAAIGFLMVHREGNYETVWGYMLFGGTAGTVILCLVKLILMML